MTLREFRQEVKRNFPHVTIKVKTVNFTDLARASAKFLTISGANYFIEVTQINEMARAAGILP